MALYETPNAGLIFHTWVFASEHYDSDFEKIFAAEIIRGSVYAVRTSTLYFIKGNQLYTMGGWNPEITYIGTNYRLATITRMAMIAGVLLAITNDFKLLVVDTLNGKTKEYDCPNPNVVLSGISYYQPIPPHTIFEYDVGMDDLSKYTGEDIISERLIGPSNDVIPIQINDCMMGFCEQPLIDYDDQFMIYEENGQRMIQQFGAWTYPYKMIEGSWLYGSHISNTKSAKKI